MSYKDKLAEAQRLFEQAKAALSNEGASSEEKARVPALVKEAQALKAQAVQLREIETEAADVISQIKSAAQDKAVAQDAEEQKKTTPQGKFKAWGEFLQAAHAANFGSVDERLRVFKSDGEEPTARKDMSGATGATGGYLVPVEFRADLFSEIAESAIVRPRATIIPMRRRQIALPVLDQQRELETGLPRFFGGMQFYWAEEAAEKTATEAKFKNVTLTARKLVGYTRSSDELLEDAAVSLEAFLAGPMGFAGGAAWMEDYAFLSGTGAGQPLGVINAPATITVSRDVSGKVRYDDLVRMLEKLLPSANAVWLFSQSVMSDLMKMTDDDGRLIWGSAIEGRARMVLGQPYIFTEKLPVKGQTGDVMLADFSRYLIGDRQAPTVQSTQFDRFQYDQTSWRMVHRVDGQPWLSAPLTFQDGVTQVSPFVILGSTVS